MPISLFQLFFLTICYSVSGQISDISYNTLTSDCFSATAQINDPAATGVIILGGFISCTGTPFAGYGPGNVIVRKYPDNTLVLLRSSSVTPAFATPVKIVAGPNFVIVQTSSPGSNPNQVLYCTNLSFSTCVSYNLTATGNLQDIATDNSSNIAAVFSSSTYPSVQTLSASYPSIGFLSSNPLFSFPGFTFSRVAPAMNGQFIIGGAGIQFGVGKISICTYDSSTGNILSSQSVNNTGFNTSVTGIYALPANNTVILTGYFNGNISYGNQVLNGPSYGTDGFILYFPFNAGTGASGPVFVPAKYPNGAFGTMYGIASFGSGSYFVAGGRLMPTTALSSDTVTNGTYINFIYVFSCNLTSLYIVNFTQTISSPQIFSSFSTIGVVTENATSLSGFVVDSGISFSFSISLSSYSTPLISSSSSILPISSFLSSLQSSTSTSGTISTTSSITSTTTTSTLTTATSAFSSRTTSTTIILSSSLSTSVTVTTSSIVSTTLSSSVISSSFLVTTQTSSTTTKADSAPNVTSSALVSSSPYSTPSSTPSVTTTTSTTTEITTIVSSSSRSSTTTSATKITSTGIANPPNLSLNPSSATTSSTTDSGTNGQSDNQALLTAQNNLYIYIGVGVGALVILVIGGVTYVALRKPKAIVKNYVYDAGDTFMNTTSLGNTTTIGATTAMFGNTTIAGAGMTTVTGGITLVSTENALSLPGFFQTIPNVDFVLKQELARGGGGSVHLADPLSMELKERSQNERVIVKVVHDNDPAHSAQMAKVFEQEVATMYYFKDHPNIAKMLGYSARPMMIVMKYYEMGSLEKFIYNPGVQWSPRLLMKLTTDIGKGICAMHQAGFCHSDIKPANVLLEKGKGGRGLNAVLTDFGITQIVDAKNIVSGFAKSKIQGASMIYAAPEIVRILMTGVPLENTDPVYVKARDVYAFAIILVEMLNR